MFRHPTLAFAASLMLAGAPAFAEGTTPSIREAKPGLLKKAKITAAQAIAAADAKVPGAMLQSAEIEEERGKLIYSFDFKSEGRSGIDEVNVDALTGEVQVVHESPADEAREKAHDKARRSQSKKVGAAKPLR